MNQLFKDSLWESNSGLQRNYYKYVEMMEFNKIVKQLKDLAMTAGARARFDGLGPMLSEAELRVRQKETSEARRLLDTQGNVPLGEVGFVADITAAAARGELLNIPQLLQVAQFAVLTAELSVRGAGSRSVG